MFTVTMPVVRKTIRIVTAAVGLGICLQLLILGVLVLNPRCTPAADPAARTFQSTTTDGVVLRGEIVGNPASQPIVIFAHGYRSNRRESDAIAADLIAAGYAVAKFDFRGSGASDGIVTTAGVCERTDVVAIVDHLVHDHGALRERMALVGFSMGAVATALAADRLSGIGAVVLVAPYGNLEETVDARTRRWVHLGARPWLAPAFFMGTHLLGVDPRSVAPESSVARFGETPVLFVAGESDWRAPPAAVRRLYDRAGPRRSIAILPALDHPDLQQFPTALRALVSEFLRNTIH